MGMYEKQQMCANLLLANLKEGDHLGHPGVDTTITVKLFSEKGSPAVCQ
jgi:hypothetical protein